MMSGGTDDQALIEACRAGRPEAFGELVSRYQDRLYPTAVRLTGQPDDAYDLLQDAFLRSFEKLDRFQGESSFYTWIYRIMVNLALSARRRSRARPRLVEAGEIGPHREPQDPSPLTNPALPVELAERDAMIQSALNALPADFRVVVVMKEFDGLRYEEIATALGIPVGTVRSRLHRARLELHDRLRSLIDLESPEHLPTAHETN